MSMAWWLLIIALSIGLIVFSKKFFKNRLLKNTLLRTPLHYAVISDNFNRVKSQIKRGADLAAQDVFGKTPLHMAKNKIIADCLIASGSPVNVKDVYGITANPFAQDKTPPDIITCCFPHNLPAINPTYKSYAGCDSRIIGAVWKKEIIPYLVLHGADVNSALYGDSIPLELAVMFEEFDFATELLKAGANINSKNGLGETIFNCTAGKIKALNAIKFLLKHGADITALDEDGSSATMHAVRNIGFALLDLGGFWQHHDPTEAKIAETEEKIEVLKYLITKGAPINSANNKGQTALHYAAIQNFSSMVKILVNHGADCSAKDTTGKTPLDSAKERGNFEIVDYLRAHCNPHAAQN